MAGSRLTDVAAALELATEEDILLARRWARQIGAVLQLDLHDQSRLATAVSEIARNAISHGGGGHVEFMVAPDMLLVRVRDVGPGVSDVAAILEGRLGGSGIAAARRLTDHFQFDSVPGRGTSVTLGKRLWRPADPGVIAGIGDMLAEAKRPDGPAELQQCQRELLDAYTELRQRELEISRLDRELEETNRGVVALYAELDERAAELGRVAEMKSRVLSDISHEVRTPLNAIVNITRLLLARLDGELSAEQERQVRLIRDSTTAMTELVTDLLELARMEAGKAAARIGEFSVDELFGTLRGMFRPLISSDSVVLTFEPAPHLPSLQTDEGKVGQILRNLIANALKFTPSGEVRVRAALHAPNAIAFTVSDTGVGITQEDQERIFHEYVQVDGPVQRRAQGSGLGLPLSRRLSEFLGGSLTVQSVLGAGSTFTAVIPCRYVERRSSERGGSPNYSRSPSSRVTERPHV